MLKRPSPVTIQDWLDHLPSKAVQFGPVERIRVNADALLK
jgi:hypothetical protein